MSNDVEPLLREREGYVRRGLADRVAQVDAELKRLGHEIETTTAGPEETATRKPVKRAAKKSTASAD